ncbi:MAG: hypothetical protein ACLQU3_14515 [Limisphaerales bacterium]
MADERKAREEKEQQALRKARRTQMVQAEYTQPGSGIVHGFGGEIARRVGVKAACVFQYLRYRASQSPTKTARCSLTQIQKACPYLDRDDVRGARSKLCQGKLPLMKAKRQPGHITVYTPDFEADTGKQHTFLVDVARQVGVLAAVLYSHIHFWLWSFVRSIVDARAEFLLEQVKKRKDYCFDEEKLNDEAFRYAENRARFYLSPSQAKQLRSYGSQRTIERALKIIADRKLLRKERDGQRRVWWRFPVKTERAMLKNLKEFGLEVMGRRQIPTVTVKFPQQPPNSHTQPPNSHSPTSQISTPACTKPAFVEPSLKTHVSEDIFTESKSLEEISQVPGGTVRTVFADAHSSPEAGSSQPHVNDDSEGHYPEVVSQKPAEYRDERTEKKKAKDHPVDTAVNVKLAGELILKAYADKDRLVEAYYQLHHVRLNPDDFDDWSKLVDFQQQGGANGAKRQLAAGADLTLPGKGAKRHTPEQAGIAGERSTNGEVDDPDDPARLIPEEYEQQQCE